MARILIRDLFEDSKVQYGGRDLISIDCYSSINIRHDHELLPSSMFYPVDLSCFRL